MNKNRSQRELGRLVETAVNSVYRTAERGLWFCVDNLEHKGWPPEQLDVWATLHYLPAGSPFCCGEPNCQLGIFAGPQREVSEHVREAMHLKQELVVHFGEHAERVRPNYQAGVAFTYKSHFEIDGQLIESRDELLTELFRVLRFGTTRKVSLEALDICLTCSSGGFILKWLNSSFSREHLGDQFVNEIDQIFHKHGRGGSEASDGVELILI